MDWGPRMTIVHYRLQSERPANEREGPDDWPWQCREYPDGEQPPVPTGWIEATPEDFVSYKASRQAARDAWVAANVVRPSRQSAARMTRMGEFSDASGNWVTVMDTDDAANWPASWEAGEFEVTAACEYQTDAASVDLARVARVRVVHGDSEIVASDASLLPTWRTFQRSWTGRVAHGAPLRLRLQVQRFGGTVESVIVRRAQLSVKRVDQPPPTDNV